MSDELWEIELDGLLVETPHKVAAHRARLVRKVGAWDAGAAREFAFACLDRLAGHAAAEVSAAGLLDAAQELEAARLSATDAGGIVRLRGAATAAARAASKDRQASVISWYLDDAAAGVDADEPYPPATFGYIAARAASQRSGSASDVGYEEERRVQASWLVRRLSLAVDL